MKILTLIILLLTACRQDEDPEPKLGCLIGYSQSDKTKTRILIWCCTRKQALAGDNVSLGGNERVKYFLGLRFEENCTKCQ